MAANGLATFFASNPAWVDELGYGVNGSLGLNLSIPKVNASVTFNLAKGSIIDTGTATPGLYFRGEASDNLFQGTRLASYMKYIRPTTTFTVDGAAQPVAGLLNATFMTTYDFFTFSASATATVNGTGLFTSAAAFSATTNGTLSFLGGSQITYTGFVQPWATSSSTARVM